MRKLCSILFTCSFVALFFSDLKSETRVIMGFELDNMAKEIGVGQVNGMNFYTGHRILPADSSKVRVDSVASFLYLDSTEATEGTWSRVYPIYPNIWSYSKINGRIFSFQPESYSNSFASLIGKGVYYDDFFKSQWRMTGTMFNFQIDSLPLGHNWNGFNKLRMDVKSGANTAIRIRIGDDKIWPMICRTFTVPAGEWKTLEVDLDSAVIVRGLDLSDMMDCWIQLVSTDAPTSVYYDNVRLETADVIPSFPLIVDSSPYSFPKPRARYAVKVGDSPENDGMEGSGKFPYKTILDTNAIPIDPFSPAKRAGLPAVVNITKEIFLADTKSIASWPSGRELLPVAYDKDNMAVMFATGTNPLTTWVACSEDGGLSWGGIGGSAMPTSLGAKSDDTYGGAGVSESGSELHRIPLFGCVHYKPPTDRGALNKIQLTENGWTRQNVWLPIPYELRHCSEHLQSLRLLSGRIWTTTCGQGPFRTDSDPTWQVRESNDLFAIYSDDGGKSWNSWREGYTSRVNDQPLGASGTYGDRNLMAPFNGHIAVYADTKFWIFNGSTWSQPFGDTQYPRCLHSTSDGQTLLWTRNNVKVGSYTTNGGVKSETLPGNTIKYGKLGQVGDRVVHVARSSDKTLLLSWFRSVNGEWSGPDTLVQDSENGIYDFAITKFAPAEYFIVAYSLNNKPGRLYAKIIPATDGATANQSHSREIEKEAGNIIRVFTNPFVLSAVIEYRIDREQSVSMDVYNVAGKLVKTIFQSKTMQKGRYQTVWDGTTVDGNRAPVGMYFVRLDNGKHVVNTQITLLK